MELLWDTHNVTHLRRHGVSTQLAEAVFFNGQNAIHGTSVRWRFVLEREVGGRACRLFSDRTLDGKPSIPSLVTPLRGTHDQET